MEIETSISSNQPMANVLEDGSQIDVQVPSTQSPDPRDIFSTSGKCKGKKPQIPRNKYRKFSQLDIIELKVALERTERAIKIFKMLKDNRSAVTQIKEPPYKRRKSSFTDDSE